MIFIFPLLLVFVALVFYFLPLAVFRYFQKSSFIFSSCELKFFKGIVLLFVVSTIGLMILAMLDQKHVEKVEQLEQLKNKNRYFTLQKDMVYGEIILPKGSHVAKYMEGGLQPILDRDLNDLEGVRFPYPIPINGAMVIAISPKYGKMQLTEDFNYVSSLGERESCQKGKTLYYFAYSAENLPQDYQPSQWSFSGCEDSQDEIHPPFWQGGRLYSPIQGKYIQ